MFQVGRSSTHRSLLSLLFQTVIFNAVYSTGYCVIHMPAELRFLIREYHTSSNAAVPYFIAHSALALLFAAIQLSSPVVAYFVSAHEVPPGRLALDMCTHFLNHCASSWVAFIVTAASSSSAMAVGFGTQDWLSPGAADMFRDRGICVCSFATGVFAVVMLAATSGVCVEVSRTSLITRCIGHNSFIRHGLVTLVLSHIG